MFRKAIKILYILFLPFIFFSCKDECLFDENFLNENAKDKPSLLQVISDNSSCEKLTLKGVFYYQPDEFKIDDKIYRTDSAYSYSTKNNDIIFDFSKKKRPGTLKVNDSLQLTVNYFMDINSKKGDFRLFKIDDIGDYHGLDLSIVLVANYNYRIVGDFVTGEENGELFAVGYSGYIPDEEYFYSIFKSVQLL